MLFVRSKASRQVPASAARQTLPPTDALNVLGSSFQRQPSRIDLLAACLVAGVERRNPDETIMQALSSPAMDYGRFAELAGRHLVTPMLKDCLLDPRLRQRLPEDFVRYVDVLHEQNRQRNAALRLQLSEVARHLDRIGIEPLLLKGAIHLVDDLYPCSGWRFMHDLDILVARERVSDAVTHLEACGFRFTQSRSDWPEHHRHLPPLYRQGDGAVIELHTDLLSQHRDLCPASAVLARSEPVDLDGVIVRVPDKTDQLAHLIGHDLTDGFLRRSSTLRLRSLLETALLCRDDAVVADLHARCERSVTLADVNVALGLAARFFPNQIAPLPPARPSARLRIRKLSAMERLDETGRWRRLVWFLRLRCSKLLRLPAERQHLAGRLLSLDYYHRCMHRLRRLWASD